MKKVIATILPFALLATSLVSCGGQATEYTVSCETNGVTISKPKATKGQDFIAEIGINFDLVEEGTTLPEKLTKVTSGNSVVTDKEYTYTLKDSNKKADFKIPAANVVGDIAIDLTLVVPDIKVTSIEFTLAKDEAEIEEEVEIQNIVVLPKNATNKNITWSLSDPDAGEIITTGANPIIKGKTPTDDPIKVIATAADGSGVKAEQEITFTIKFIKSLTLTMSNELKIGETKQPGVEIEPIDAGDPSWHLEITDGDDFAYIEENGHEVTGVDAGTVTMKAVADDGSDVESNEVTFNVVKVPATSITVTADDYELYPGDTTQLYTVVEPDDATVKDVTYEVTEGDDVVEVDEDGVVTAIKNGEATITATLIQDVGESPLTDTVTITVEEDLLIGAHPATEKEALGFSYLNTYAQRISVVKLTNSNTGSWQSCQFHLHHAAEITGTLAFDVYGEGLTNNSFAIRVYDGQWNEIDKTFNFNNVVKGGEWTTIHTNLYLNVDHSSTNGNVDHIDTLSLIRLSLEGKDEGSIYIDNVRFEKGSTFTKNTDVHYKDYDMARYDAKSFYPIKQVYMPIKAAGSGTFKFMLETDGWEKNFSGDTIVTMTDGVPTSVKDRWDNDVFLDCEEIGDGWYGLSFKLKGANNLFTSGDTAMAMFYICDITSLTSVSVDLSKIDVFTPSVFFTKENVTLGEATDGYDISSWDDGGTNTLNIRIKAVPSSASAPYIDFVLQCGSWNNYSGEIKITFNDDNTLTIENSGTDKTVNYEALGDGWFNLKFKRANFKYPHGQTTGNDKLRIIELKSFENTSKLYIDLAGLTIKPIE